MANKQAMTIGPWPGGMNSRDDPAEISDQELVSIVNFDVEETGALIPRRGWQEVTITGVGLYPVLPLGIYTSGFNNPKAVFTRKTNTSSGSETSAFCSMSGTTYETIVDGSATPISRSGLFAAVFNMNKLIYFVPDWRSGVVGVGFSLNNLSGVNPVNVPAIPTGQYAFVMGDRAFVFNPDIGRLYWSKATDPTIWAAPDGGYVDIDPSDNPFTDCLTVRDTAYFIRAQGIYSFNFTSDPGIDGSINNIANTEGAVRGFVYQNELYLITPRGLFKFINGYMSLVTNKVAFGVQTGLASTSDNNGVSVIEHTAWIRSWDGASISHTAVNLKTGAVSKYDHTNVSALNGSSVSDARYTYIPNTVGSLIAVITNQRSSTRVNAGPKSFTYSFTTKRYSFSSRLIFKRLISWLVDYNAGVNFYDGNNSTKFFVKVNPSSSYTDQINYTGTTVASSNSKDGRINTPSLRFKDIQFGLQSSQIGAANPAGYSADAGITVRGILLYMAGSREVATAQA